MRGSLLVQILGGLAIGLAMGLLIAWVISPVEYTDTSPASMREEFKDQYRSAIASAFNSTGNLERARARLSLVGDASPEQALISQAERMLISGSAPDSAFEIAMLINALNLAAPAIVTEPVVSDSSTATSEPDLQPTATQTPFGLVTTPRSSPTLGESPAPRPTSTQKPTATATPTKSAPFILVSREELCDPDNQPGLLMVEVRNKKRQPIAGEELIISWSGGEESFFTGLKPEISDGYADFEMLRNTIYSLHLAAGGEPANGLSVSICTSEDGEEYLGSINLIFQQP